MKNNPKLLVIVGPTASGKSDLAVRLAKKYGGEVISADSRQVYKGLNIGTGKITRRDMKGVKHHLLDVADPKRQFTVEQYQRLASKAIEDMISRGKLPIICGGTGFYIDSVVNGMRFPSVKASPRLRKRLAKKSAAQLFALLKKIGKKKARDMNESDRQNPRRLIRAIEILKSGNARQSRSHAEVGPLYDVTYIGLNPPKDQLRKRIHARLMSRMKQGMVAEARDLYKNGLSWKRMDELGLEYRYIARYLQGKISKDEMLAKLETEICRYAKRQMTWWRRNKEIRWIQNGFDFKVIH